MSMFVSSRSQYISHEVKAIKMHNSHCRLVSQNVFRFDLAITLNRDVKFEFSPKSIDSFENANFHQYFVL